MRFAINNHVIDEPMFNILKEIQTQTKGRYLKDIIIRNGGKDISITCPFHKDGMESSPACNVVATSETADLYGSYHCFACGAVGNLTKLVSQCFDISNINAENWLCDNFANSFIEYIDYLPPIELDVKEQSVRKIPDSVLDDFDIYHPYMAQRKLTPHVCKMFKVGYNRNSQSITFPVWDEFNNLVMITERSVNSKRFYIPENINKPVYLLNHCLNMNIDTVLVVESQINCLTSWGYHIPSIGLIGTGSSYQYDILNKSPIRRYVLCFDGDMAGYRGEQRFRQNIRKDVLVDSIHLGKGEDLNSISYEKFLMYINTSGLNVDELIRDDIFTVE